jgi:hypothetical protein
VQRVSVREGAAGVALEGELRGQRRLKGELELEKIARMNARTGLERELAVEAANRL